MNFVHIYTIYGYYSTSFLKKKVLFLSCNKKFDIKKEPPFVEQFLSEEDLLKNMITH